MLSSGFVQIGPMGNDEGNNADSFLIRMGQTAGFGYAPNKRWPNAFMSTGFEKPLAKTSSVMVCENRAVVSSSVKIVEQIFFIVLSFH